eukprot:684584-Rhodomonas_salina.3
MPVSTVKRVTVGPRIPRARAAPARPGHASASAVLEDQSPAIYFVTITDFLPIGPNLARKWRNRTRCRGKSSNTNNRKEEGT